MGGYLSTGQEAGRPSREELSRALAERFATKCFTHLELTHFKDNFYSRALNEDGIRYWNEAILSAFLGLPDGPGTELSAPETPWDKTLDPGPVIFRVASYLGAFPFQKALAPTMLTFEAMVKVVVLVTNRYEKVLKKGKSDQVRLLFGSLADVARKPAASSDETSIGNTEDSAPDDETRAAEEDGQETHSKQGSQGFSVDMPSNDEETVNDDDDLALAALESLDAIDVFKLDQRIERTTHEAKVSEDTLRRLLALLLAIAPLRTHEDAKRYTTNLDHESMAAIHSQVDAIVAAFPREDPESKGFEYKAFYDVVRASLPYMLNPLTALFEQFLFSANLDLSKRRDSKIEEQFNELVVSDERPRSPITCPGAFESVILNDALMSQLSFFLPTQYPDPFLFTNGTKLHPVFSSAAHGESLTSFSHHVLTWLAPTILLISGEVTSDTASKGQNVTLGAYLPRPWSSTSSSYPPADALDPSTLPYLFQLTPTHIVLPGNPSLDKLATTMPISHFSKEHGIAIGCRVPPRSRSSHPSSKFKPEPTGGGSLLIDPALENATLVVSDGLNGEGVILPNPCVPPSRRRVTRVEVAVYAIEVWGVLQRADACVEGVGEEEARVSPSLGRRRSSLVDPLEEQRKRWRFEEREAERSRNINRRVGGSESEEATGRALLEMAGIIGEDSRRGSRY